MSDYYNEARELIESTTKDLRELGEDIHEINQRGIMLNSVFGHLSPMLSDLESTKLELSLEHARQTIVNLEREKLSEIQKIINNK